MSISQNIIKATTTAVSADKSTAPAAISLTIPACLFFSGETRSTRFSIEVLSISVTITKPITTAKTAFSDSEKL